MYRSAILSSAALGLLAAAGGTALGAPNDSAETRRVRAAEGFTAQRGPDEVRDASTLRELEPPAADVARRGKGESMEAVASVLFGDHWIYDAAAELFYDYDGDGYYHYLRVRFDADSYYEHAWVYAKLYLSGDGRAWELYAVTEEFWVDGSTALDEYEVETELVEGYPRGLYDVLIELYDADEDLLVDEFGPAESSALALLPLEDAFRDGAEPPPVSHSVGHGGGGAVSWLLAPLALAAGLMRRRDLRAPPRRRRRGGPPSAQATRRGHSPAAGR